MKKLLLGSVLLGASATSLAEGIFLGGGTLSNNSSLECGATYCGQVEVEYELDTGIEPINTAFSHAEEPYFNWFRKEFNSTYVTDLGTAYIDADATASQYVSNGFYLLTKSFEYGQLPQASNC